NRLKDGGWPQLIQRMRPTAPPLPSALALMLHLPESSRARPLEGKTHLRACFQAVRRVSLGATGRLSNACDATCAGRPSPIFPSPKAQSYSAQGPPLGSCSG